MKILRPSFWPALPLASTAPVLAQETDNLAALPRFAANWRILRALLNEIDGTASPAKIDSFNRAPQSGFQR